MKRKDIVFQTLNNEAKNKGMSAGELAERLGLDRANVSSDLNRLWEEGKVRKHQGRPVVYSVCDRVNEVQPNVTALDELSQKNNSLKTAVEQGKAAVLYPPQGMHILILGETGVGKSMFAELLHQYAVDVGKMSANAPLVTFNCADYANNPQLLLGQLFGVKKGAYTGAKEQNGLMAKADGGILFLDEVHRLPPEGQEMLFMFIDKGVFRKLGETEVERTANVLLIAATTEDPGSSLLTTFRRRMSMVIQLPSLRERSIEERYALILQFFKDEGIRLGRGIRVSPNTIRALLYYHCTHNVGQLKSDIQLTCAKAYADFVTLKKEQMQINSSDLPPYVKEGLLYAKRRQETVDIHHNDYMFHPDEMERPFTVLQEQQSHTIYEKIEQKFNELKARGIEDDELDLLMEIDIENYFTQYIKRMNHRMNEGDLAKIIEPRVIAVAKNIVKYVEEQLALTLSDKVLHGLALHIQTSINRVENGKEIVNPQLNKMRRSYKKEFGVALDCIKMIEDHFGIDLPIDEAGFLTMFFVLDYADLDETEHNVQILVMTHGSGGATAMVDVTNQLLGANYATAVDMPLSMEPKDAYATAKNRVQQMVSPGGLLLLADMGSLLTFGDMLASDLGIPVKVLPMVSTPHVLEATRKAMLGYSLDQLYEDVKQLSLFYPGEVFIETGHERQQPKWVIVTACLTGQGSALAIKKVLENYLTFDAKWLEIVPVDIANVREMKRLVAELKRNKKLLCIVSNFVFKEDIPQFHIENVLNLKAVEPIQRLIETEETYDKMAETLKHHLLNVDPRQVVPDIRMCLDQMQAQLNFTIPTNDLIGIVLHGSCMIDRVIKRETSVTFKHKKTYIQTHQTLYNTTRDILATLEQTYEVKLTDDEICYMMSFFDPERRTSYATN